LFDVEHILLTDLNDPKIEEITTWMSRYVCNLETEQERLKEKAFIYETTVPFNLTRYTPDKVASKQKVMLTPQREKNGSKIAIAPGVICLVMFMQKKGIDEKSAMDATKYYMDYFIKQIKGAYADNNDILIDGKKTLGFALIYNSILDRIMIRLGLIMRSEGINKLTADEDFTMKKYKSLTGVCEETGMDENAVRKMVNGFIDIALSWRKEDAN